MDLRLATSEKRERSCLWGTQNRCNKLPTPNDYPRIGQNSCCRLPNPCGFWPAFGGGVIASARDLKQRLDPLAIDKPPIAGLKGKGVVWTRPEIRVEVEYRGRTTDGSLRHPRSRVFARISSIALSGFLAILFNVLGLLIVETGKLVAGLAVNMKEFIELRMQCLGVPVLGPLDEQRHYPCSECRKPCQLSSSGAKIAHRTA